MPKISPIKGHNDSSFQIDSIPARSFSKVKDDAPKPIIRAKPAPVYDSVVPIYEVSYDPQFSKSPLASIEITRKEKTSGYVPVIPQLYDEPEPRISTVRRQNFQYEEQQKCDWKSILCWVGGFLGVILFILGLYLLVNLVMGGISNKSSTLGNIQNGENPSEVDPMYVNPIPFDRISPSPPPNSIAAAPIARPQEMQTAGMTSPSILPGPLETLSDPNSASKVNETKKPAAVKPFPQATATNSNNKPDNPVQWGIDPWENSIEPLNAYQTNPS